MKCWLGCGSSVAERVTRRLQAEDRRRKMMRKQSWALLARNNPLHRFWKVGYAELKIGLDWRLEVDPFSHPNSVGPSQT
jgi:hypothetical protein